MLKKLFLAVLLISLVAIIFGRDELRAYYNRYILKSDTTVTSNNVQIDNLVLASNTIIELSDKLWIANFAERLSNKNFKVNEIYYDNYHDVYYRLDIGEVRANTINDMNVTWNDLLSALNDDVLSKKLVQKREDLEYLDLRFQNKLFYKFKIYEEGILATSTASSTTRE